MTQDESQTEFSVSIPFFTPQPRIPEGVTVNSQSVGGLTEKDAKKALERLRLVNPNSQDFLLEINGKEIPLLRDKIDAHWDYDKAIQTAFLVSTGDIPLSLSADKEYILERIQNEFASEGGIYTPSGFWLEGTRIANEDGTYSGQTLVLTKGTSGLNLDLELLYYQIVSQVSIGEFSLAVNIPNDIKEPAELDLTAIYRETALKPINPDINRTSLDIVPGKNGYGFLITSAEALLQQADSGDLVRVPMITLTPAISLDEVWFIDTLGYYKTPYTDNENRNENLRLACSKLDGLILQPGEILSYNQLLGKRTKEAGYKPAPAYSGTELVDEIGGGICQVSSTLYLSSLLADLNIVERKNHGFPASYIPLGLDATVNWGTTDLKIKNNYDLPIKIKAEVADGHVSIKILGVDQRDYYVKMEYRVDDHPSYASAYRCKYSKETDEQISRVLDHTSIYLEDVWCWPGYAENAADLETPQT